jgi:uncharacterized protein (DUF362 family)
MMVFKAHLTKDRMDRHRIGILKTDATQYSSEWQFEDDFPEKSSLRELARLLNHDGNPYIGFLKPGDNVVVKPNWVLDRHPRGENIFSVITHSAVLRAVVDLVYEAIDGTGTITIADAPQWNCNFENLLVVTEVEAISDYYRTHYDFDVPVIDLRQIGAREREPGEARGPWIRTTDRLELVGDPRGYVAVDLGAESAFIGMPNVELVYGADYDRSETRLHHNAARHEYLISKTILEADALISVPKLKVHKKVGVTINAKGMVGLNGNKNWLAHYRLGSPSSGGDQFPDGRPLGEQARSRLLQLVRDQFLARKSGKRDAVLESAYRAYRVIKPLIRRASSASNSEIPIEGGNWYGNDTAWRMTADLARIALYADAEGRIRETPQRRFYSVVDGIVAGERKGPLAPDAKNCGVLVAGENLLAVDVVCARLMGFDWKKLRSLSWLAFESPQDVGSREPEHDIAIVSNVPEWEALLADPFAVDLRFRPHPAWTGQIEIEQTPTEPRPV